MALTLEEFLPKARALNPDYTDNELIQAYQDRYAQPPTHTVSPAPLMTLQEFLPKARQLNPDYSDEELTQAWQEKYGDRGAREKDQGDFVRGGVTAFKQIPQTVRGLEAGAGAIGEKIAGEGGLFTAMKEHGLKGYQEHGADIAKDSKPSDSATEAYKMAKAGNAGALVDWLQYALGYGGGQALQTLATAGIGYAGGKLALQPAAKVVAEKMIAKESARLAATGVAGDQLAKQAVANVAGRIGQTVALAATAVGQEGGEIYGGLVEKAAQEGRQLTGAELAKATGATLGAGALEFLGDKVGLDLVLGRSLAGKVTSSRLGHAATAGALGVATEGGTEFAQTLAEEFGKGNEPFSSESLRQGVDAAALGGVGGGAVGAVGGIANRPDGQVAQPVVTERTPEDMGLAQPTSQPPPGPLALEGPPQPGELRKGTVYAPGEVLDVSPLPDVSPVLNAGSLDDAIANAVGVVRGATDTAKARAAEFARMTAKAKNETDALLANAQPKRSGTAIPEIAGYEPPPPKIGTIENPPKAWMQEGMVELPTLAGPAFTPRPEQIDDPRARLAEERARLVAQRDQQRLTPKNPVSEPVAPVQAVAPADTPLPSQIDLAYPSSKQVRDLIHEKGFHLDTPVFREYLKMAVGKEKFSDLTPQELQTLAEKVQKIKAPQQPTPTQEAPPQVPLTPAVEKPYAPVTTIPEAQVPRSELTPEKNAEMLLRAEKAKADLEVAGQETGRRKVFTDNATEPGQTVTGLASASPEWYTELQSGPGKVSADYKTVNGKRVQTKTARQKIEEAIQKIIKDEGADRGKAVEQVKAALLADTEFHKTEWGRDLNSIMQGEWPSWIDKPQGVTQATENAQEFQNVERGTPQAAVEVPKPKKVPLSRTERLAQQKQKMEGKAKAGTLIESQLPKNETVKPGDRVRWFGPIGGDSKGSIFREGTVKRVLDRGWLDIDADDKKLAMFDGTQVPYTVTYRSPATKPEPSPSNAPEMESQPATASPERAPAPSTSETAPTTEEPFSLSAPEVSKPKAKDAGPEQLGIEIPPETIGSRPIIGREATLDEAPLFSKNAQTPDAEQTAIPEESAQSIAPDIMPAQSQPAQSPETAQSPTEIIAEALRTAADKIQGKPAVAGTINTIEVYEAFQRRLRDGEVTLDEYKQAFQQVKDNKEALVGELKKLTKDQLIKRSRSLRSSKNDSKDELVRQSYEGMLSTFSTGRGVSYVLSGKGGYEQALAKMVDETTEADLKKYAEDIAQATADYKKRLEGFENPQTLQNFDDRIRIKGEASLTPEQLARYDELLAEAGRAKRKQAQEQKATVQGVDAGTDLQLIESKHTKTGEKLWVVKLANRVDRAVYDRLNQAAHKLGGRYSSYNKDGAIPGFTFRSEEAAKSFMAAGKGETVSAAPVREAAKAEVPSSAVSKLREMADKLESEADESLNADRKTNTARRARMASSAENAAYGNKALAETMRNLADAIESGEATHLSGLRTKAQVEMLDSMIERAKYDRIKQETKGSYVDYERQKHRKAEPEDAAFASYPELDGSKSELFSAYKDLATIKGADRLRNRFYKQAESLGEDQRVKLSREDVELAIEKYPRKSGIPWHWPETLAKLKRLESMGITSLPELRAALREYVEYRGKRGTIDKAKQLERNLIGNKGIGIDFFPTPKETAQRMVAEAGIEPGMKVLEPSAGNGNIAEVIRAAGVNPDVVELSSNLREILEAKGFNLVGQDFMDLGGKSLEGTTLGISLNGMAREVENAQQLIRKYDPKPGEGGTYQHVTRAKATTRNANADNAATLWQQRRRQLADAVRSAMAEGYQIPDHIMAQVGSSVEYNSEGKYEPVVSPGGQYDRIVMNPPFSNGQDAEHIHHAYELLKPGGKLVAIAGEGIFFRNDAKATAFRKWLEEVDGTSEKLPEGTFKDASLMATTGVNARMVTIEKPVEEVSKPDSFLSFLMDERGSIPASIFGRRKGTEETGTIDPTEVRDRLAAVKTSVRPYLLGALGMEQLSQVYGNDHAEVKAYNQATQAMEADFTEMSRESDKVARAWTELKIPVADKMAQVMEDARFLNFDPDPKKNQEADSAKKQALVTRFQQLPDDAKAVYRMARDYYTNMAEQRFQALKERIERAGGTPENTRKLVDRLQLAYEKVRSKVYFPFSRFGENIVIAKQMKDGQEVDREVHAFESVVEAQKFATMMKLKGWQVKQTVAREYSVDQEGPASKIVRQMHDIIKELGQGQQGLPGVMNLEDQLLDSLNQSFLQALPDMSYAKHFIHAKDVKGASKDALRAFAHSALHGAHHISRIRHADMVTKALMNLDQNINETAEGTTEEARQVYNELVRRHNDIMNPNTHPFAAWLGQLGFTMSLGGVVATGITNATQVPLVTYPWMGARYGFGKASAALARAYRDFLDPRTLNKDSLFDATKSKLISESERKMLLELARRGHIDLTQTMDLAGLSARDNLSRKARTLGTVGEKVTRMLGFTFHVPEVMNRQVTALSTFRLEKEKGGSFEEALERAQQAIQDTHFIYQSFNRPRYMQGNFLRVLTQFKQYSQNIAYTYGRAASIWLDKNGATKDERAVAKRQLLSMLALQFGAAGALGMPFFGTPIDLLMAVVAAMGDDDEKRDWEVALRKWLDGQATSLAEAFIDDKEKARGVGKELAEVISHGASRLTPFDMATRLGQNDLFFREPQREREGRQAVMDWMLALGGPVPSYGVNILLGMGDVAKGMNELNAGFFLRGVEELTPAVLRNGVRSLRYTLEGVRTRDEYKQLDLSTSEKLGQVFGFTPAKVAEMYESTTAVKNKEHRILKQQEALKDRFARAVDDQDDNAKSRILEDIRGFNERNPMFAITSNTLNHSLKSRRQHEAGMERGMYLPPKRRALLEEGEFGDF